MSFSRTWGSGALTTTDGNYIWNYSDAFRKVFDNGTSVRLADKLAPLDKKTTIKVALSKIANVYSTLGGDSVPVGERSSNPTGSTLFCELTTILTKPNPAVSGAIIQVPVQARIELRVPNDGDLTDADIVDLVGATSAILKDEEGEYRIVGEMLRGALVPAGL